MSRAELYEIGFSAKQIRDRVARGALHPRYHNVFAVGHGQLTPHARLYAALLCGGGDAFLSHRSAAGVWGLRPINTHEIEITATGGGRRVPSGVTFHRTKVEPHPHDVRTRGGLRVSSVMRLLVELSPREPPAELERLVTVAVRKRLLRPDARDGRQQIEAALARHERWPGLSTLKAVLAGYRRTKSHASELELAFDRLLAAHPDIPDPQRNVHIDIWEIDRFWPEHNLAIELDGRPYHIAARDMERDRIKDVALQRLGVTPIRFTDFRVEHDVPGILSDLRHFLSLSR